MAQEQDTDQFHDSESEDIYDLYNACNGVLQDGLLDIRKLDEFSQEESETLDVAQLRAIWAHTAAGCSECEGIIRTLNLARGILRADVGELSQDPVTVIDTSYVEAE